MLAEATSGMDSGGGLAKALMLAADDGRLHSIAAHLIQRGPCVRRQELAWSSVELTSAHAAVLAEHSMAALECGAGSPAPSAHVHRFVVREGTTVAAELAAAACAARSDSGASGLGAWHSTVDLFAWETPAATKLRAAALAASEAAAHAEGGETAGHPDASATRSWVNCWAPGSSHPCHDHQDVDRAGVFYVQVPESEERATDDGTSAVGSGALLLHGAGPGPRIAARGTPNSPAPYAALTPTPGEIIVFPGWLPHGVLPLRLKPTAPQTGDAALRISAAFNFVMRQ